MNRRGFLVGVVGILLARDAAKINFKTPVKIAEVAELPPLDYIAFSNKTYKTITPIEWYHHKQSAEVNELVLRKLAEDIDKITKQMMLDSNKWFYGNDGWKPRRVEVDPPWLRATFGTKSKPSL